MKIWNCKAPTIAPNGKILTVLMLFIEVSPKKGFNESTRNYAYGT
jgi:hypothetical protein